MRGHLQASSLSSSPSEESRRDGSTLARAFSCLYFGRFHIIWHIYGRSHRSAWRVFCILFGSPYKYLRSVADPSSQGPEVIGVPLQSFWRSAIYPASLAWILLFCFASLWLDSARSSFFFVKISFFGNRSTFISVMTRCVALIVSNSFFDLVEILPKSFIVEKSNVKVASFFCQHRLRNVFLPSGDILFGILFGFFVFETEVSEDSVCLQMVNINQSVQTDGQIPTSFSLIFHSFTHQFHDGIIAEPMIIGVATASSLDPD